MLQRQGGPSSSNQAITAQARQVNGQTVLAASGGGSAPGVYLNGGAAQQQPILAQAVPISSLGGGFDGQQHALPSDLPASAPSPFTTTGRSEESSDQSSGSDDEEVGLQSGNQLLWSGHIRNCCDTMEGSLTLIDDDRILDYKIRRMHKVCCLPANVHRRHVRIPVDQITRMETRYGQRAWACLAILAIISSLVGVVALIRFNESRGAQGHSEFWNINSYLCLAAFGLVALSFAAYLSCMHGGMTAEFHSAAANSGQQGASSGAPIRVGFQAQNTGVVTDAHFEQSRAIRAITAVEAARAKWHTSGAF